MFHPERFSHHPDLMHMVIVARHFMRFGFQDDNQQIGIGIHHTLAVYQMRLIAGSFELTQELRERGIHIGKMNVGHLLFFYQGIGAVIIVRRITTKGVRQHAILFIGQKIRCQIIKLLLAACSKIVTLAKEIPNLTTNV